MYFCGESWMNWMNGVERTVDCIGLHRIASHCNKAHQNHFSMDCTYCYKSLFVYASLVAGRTYSYVVQAGKTSFRSFRLMTKASLQLHYNVTYQ